VVTVFGKSWPLHVREALGASLDENLAMIGESVAYLRAAGREVVYDAEHYFDGWRADPPTRSPRCRRRSRQAPTTVVLCDTNGGTLPERSPMPPAPPRRARGRPARHPPPRRRRPGGANALAGVLAGARQVQGTVNGYGERCGNVDLLTVLANLVLKLGADQPQPLAELLPLSRYVDDRANLEPNVRKPYVGDAAFATRAACTCRP
jgi:2-isopropylmalate synthase